ncbi:MAG: hypothetical protein CMP22_04420 [Rickettsiales bacterium]|nr:hypothetical protein [Rickettsiales bacterium]
MARKKTNKSKKASTKKKKTPQKKSSSLFWRLIKLGFVTFIWGILALILLIFINSYNLPDIYTAMKFDKNPSITILDSNQSVLARYGETKGRFLRFDEYPDHLKKAILAIEDRRYYSHFGIDPIGLSRAMYENVKAGRFVQGGSTITQQLAKILFLTPEKTLSRKFNEALTAFWLEYEYSKEDILTAYMNRVYLGAGTYGFDAAAQRYFGKTASNVTLNEAALLAGLLKAPSRYAPTNNPELAKKRMHIVLNAMQDAGFINKDMKITSTSLPTITQQGTRGSALYFTDEIMKRVNGYVGSLDNDLIVYTTLDTDLQASAAETLTTTIESYGEQANFSQGAILTLAQDGAVRAMVGGKDYKKSQFNRTLQANRQTGSAFKPLVYLTAIEQLNLDQNSIVVDEKRQYGDYQPENYKNEYLGQITLEDAFTRSINTVAVDLASQTGLTPIIKNARKAGITADLNRDLSMALGSSTIPMDQVTAAYTMLGNGGQPVNPYFIYKIQTLEGELVFEHIYFRNKPVFKKQNLDTLKEMMHRNMLVGTGRNANIDGLRLYGKTGTSQDYRDAWFMGFSDFYTTAVWLGNDNNEPMNGITGSSYPARIWRDVMSEAHKSVPKKALKESREAEDDSSFIDDIMSIFN